MYTTILRGSNTNSSSIHFLLNNDITLPSYLQMPSQLFCQLLLNTIANSNMLQKFCVDKSLIENFDKNKTLDRDFYIPINKITNQPDYDSISFIINIIQEERPIVFCDHDNEYVIQSHMDLNKSYHRLNELIHFLHNHEKVFSNKIDENTYVYYTRDKKIIVQKQYKKLQTPIIVDMKITNRCEKECQYCYEGSHKQGGHAKFERIKRFIDDNPSLVEIAIGGGEPTLHPDFMKIIRYIIKKNILVNFTTRNREFIEELPRINSELFGAIGFSIETVGELYRIPGKTKNPIAIHIIAWPHNIVELLHDHVINKIEKMLVSKEIEHVIILAPKIKTDSALEYFMEDSKEIISVKDMAGMNLYSYDNYSLQLLAIEKMRRLTEILYNKYKKIRGVAFDTPMLMYVDEDVLYKNIEIPSHKEASTYIEGGIAYYYDACIDELYNNSYERIKIQRG